jgi:hypothetical protein
MLMFNPKHARFDPLQAHAALYKTGYCQAPEKLVKCGGDLNGLKPADAIVFADAHAGNPVQTLRSLTRPFSASSVALVLLPCVL